MTTLFSPSLLLISIGPIGDVASTKIHTINDVRNDTNNYNRNKKYGYKRPN